MEEDEVAALAGERPSLEHPELYRRLLDTLAEGVCLSDEDGVIAYTNPAEDQMFGYGPGELTGRHVSILNGHSAEENTAVLETVTAELRRSGAWKGEWLNRRQNGERFYTKTHISSVDIEGRSHWLSIQEDITEERLQAEALRDRETRLEIAAEAADLGVWDWDLKTNNFIYSQQAKAICGFPLDAPVNYEDVARVTHPDDYPFTTAQAREAMDPEVRATQPYIYRLVRPDGALRWVSAHGRVVFEETGDGLKAVRYVGTLQDITERHQMELQLRESEARFRAMADSTPAPAWVTNAQGEIVFANTAFAETAGTSALALLGDAWIALMHPDDRAWVGKLRAKAWANGHEAYSFEARFTDPKGGWYWMRVATRPRFDADGAFQGYVGIATDISDARRAAADLRASEGRLRLAMESSNTADWRWTAEDDRIDLSERAAAMLGLPQEMKWSELHAAMNESNGRALAETVRTAVEERGSWEVELLITRPLDNQKVWIAARGHALFDQDQKLTGMIGLISDISERKKREETERMLVREVDHRAKNVLAVVQALARLTPFYSREQYLQDYLGRVGALGRVHGLLSQGRWSGVELKQLVLDEIEPFIADSARVSVEGDPVTVGPIVAQPLAIVLHELITNALKHGALKGDAGRLDVRWTMLGQRVRLSWRERSGDAIGAPGPNGFGATLIDSSSKQVNATFTREWSADGLVCTIEFEPRGADMAPPAVDASPPLASGRGARTRVLIVDDEPLIALDLREMVERGDGEVAAMAHSLDEALRVALNGDFDCALLDVNLGGAHIGPVIEALKKRGIPFALVTGYEDPGIDALIVPKPLSEAKVSAALATLREPSLKRST